MGFLQSYKSFVESGGIRQEALKLSSNFGDHCFNPDLYKRKSSKHDSDYTILLSLST